MTDGDRITLIRADGWILRELRKKARAEKLSQRAWLRKLFGLPPIICRKCGPKPRKRKKTA